MLAERHQVDVVGDQDRDGQGERERVRDDDVVPAGHDRRRDHARRRGLNRARDADRDGDDVGRGYGPRRRAARGMRSRTSARLTSGPAAMSIACHSWTSTLAPRSQTARPARAGAEVGDEHDTARLVERERRRRAGRRCSPRCRWRRSGRPRAAGRARSLTVARARPLSRVRPMRVSAAPVRTSSRSRPAPAVRRLLRSRPWRNRSAFAFLTKVSDRSPFTRRVQVRRSRSAVALAVGAALSLTVAACGGDDSGGGAAATSDGGALRRRDDQGPRQPVLPDDGDGHRGRGRGRPA